MHEHLRLELLRRIQRGSLSVSLLARQTGFGQAHLSNFLHSRRHLSLEALDTVLASQRLTIEDLLPATLRDLESVSGSSAVPIVSHAVALFEPVIRPAAIQMILHLPAGVLKSLRIPPQSKRRKWQRFVAVQVTNDDALGMDPLLYSGAVVLLDRHYTSLTPYRLNRPNLYAVRNGAHMALRYVDYRSRRLVLRPHNLAYPVDLIAMNEEESPSDLLTGRVALVLNEL
ncbi:MAG TPA: hypothetical protein VF730_15370 [Terracidiphilus sp.]